MGERRSRLSHLEIEFRPRLEVMLKLGTMKTRPLALLAGLAIVVAACGGSDVAESTITTTTAPETTTTETEPSTTTSVVEATAPSITFETEGWPELANGYHYEGWGIVDGEPISTGKFNVADGEVVSLEGEPMAVFEVENIEDASTIVITIEPEGDTDTIPADTHFVAGDVVDGVAQLTIGHPAALGTDFTEVAGSFLLATPTDDDGSNELSGIWFLALDGGSVPSLVLPELPAGWKYEGWGVVDGTPVTTGTFLSATGADDAAPFSGPKPGPAFPGEDFLVNAPEGLAFPTDLSGATVVISVEPSPDDSVDPFALKPLIGTADQNATDHESYDLNANSDPFPTGTATIGS